MESPDFVLMFVPIEPAFAVAINEDVSLYNKAFEQNIVIVTPSTLLATLRTIDTMWSNEKQQKNAMEIARQAGALHDQFVLFAESLTDIGDKLDKAQQAYDTAHKRLTSGKGNLVRRIERLETLGARARKSLPETLRQDSDEPEISGDGEVTDNG